jgi:hypothetical protein
METLRLVDGGLPAGYTASQCTNVDLDAGTALCDVTALCLGRMPAGLKSVGAVRSSSLGEHLARMAHLEAASVGAFRRIAAELRALGAPERLVALATRSARDEIRHARTMGALAHRHGATPPPVTVARTARRGAFELAMDNAIEGCTREALGAVIGLFQAANARDPEVRATMDDVSADEVAHAAFSFELAEYLDAQLSDAQRAHVAAARREALEALLGDADRHDRLPYGDSLGLPSSEMLRALAAGFKAELGLA